MTNAIHRLTISNFKSIDWLALEELNAFVAYAGANGCGKSNFFDALDFVSLFQRSGVETALRAHGGFTHISSEKARKQRARTFGFDIQCDLPVESQENTQTFSYSLTIHNLDGAPQVEERLCVDAEPLLTRSHQNRVEINGAQNQHVEGFSANSTALLFFPHNPLTRLLKNLRLYRIDPGGAKTADKSDVDPTQLNRDGHNLSSVLRRMQNQHSPTVDDIIDLLESIVPGLETVSTEQQRLDGRTALLFKEAGIKRRFPAHLVSDGTIYALCVLVAFLDSTADYGMTLIEEPERGLHPQAIMELVGLMRQQASPRNILWLSTHSESVVRALKLNELVLVDKKDGRTQMQRAAAKLTQQDLDSLSIDQVWLANLFGGGVPC